MYLVTVVNERTQAVAYTNENGVYTIPASNGDVIAFSSIGYITAERTKPIGEANATLSIILTPATYQLREFNFRPGTLTQFQADSIERVKTYKIYLERRPPSPFASPVSAIAEKFSKKAKRTYRFQKDFAAGEMERYIDTRYTTDLVADLTGLTGDSIGHFMNGNPMPYDFARLATDLEIKIWIRDNFKSWMKKNIPDSGNAREPLSK